MGPAAPEDGATALKRGETRRRFHAEIRPLFEPCFVFRFQELSRAWDLVGGMSLAAICQLERALSICLSAVNESDELWC